MWFLPVDIVSGMALATGDCPHKYWRTPAASAVPLTVEYYLKDSSLRWIGKERPTNTNRKIPLYAIA
jgi:hypothetical protein